MGKWGLVEMTIIGGIMMIIIIIEEVGWVEISEGIDHVQG